MKMKLFSLAIGLLVGMYAFANKMNMVPGMYYMGYLGENFVYKNPNFTKKTIKETKDQPFSSGFYQLEPDISYDLSCSYYSADYKVGEKLPITLHWKSFDESNMIYYMDGQKITPKQENGKIYLNLPGQRGMFSIRNVVKLNDNEHTPDLDLDFDNSEHSLLYYCYVIKDV